MLYFLGMLFHVESILYSPRELGIEVKLACKTIGNRET